MTTRAVVLALAAGAVGVIVGRASPRDAARSITAESAPPVAAPLDCKGARSELASMRAQLAICMAYAPPRATPAQTRAEAPVPAAVPTERPSIDGILAELPAIRARRDNAREIVYVKHRDGRLRSYLPEEWPPDGGIDGGRILMRKLPDGTWEDYDPPPHIVKLAGPPGPDGLVTMPDGRRVRYIFTDGGAP